MKPTSFEITGKITYFKKHDNGGLFLLVTRKSEKGEYFSYPVKKITETNDAILSILEQKPLAIVRGRISAEPVAGQETKIEIRLIAESIGIMMRLED